MASLHRGGPGVHEVEPGDRPGPSRRVPETAARFVRLFGMGATLLYLLVGVASGASPATPGAVVWAVAVGIGFHVYSHVGNDVMDLPLDRTDPRRAASPLVRGVISAQQALGLSLTTVPLLIAGTGFAFARPALGPMVGALVLIGVYNIAGKAVPIPFVADVVQGLGWAALVVAGAQAGGGVTATTGWAALAVVVYIVMVNGLHGAVRDAANDERAGAHTTALLLGARVVEGGSAVLPPGVVAWGVALQAGFGMALIGVLAVPWDATSARWYLAVTVAVAAYLAASGALAGAFRERADLRVAMAHGTRHLFLLPAALLAAAARMMPGWMVAVASLAFLLPPWLFGRAVRGHEFDMPASSLTERREAKPLRPRLSGLWRMTRPGTPAAGAVLVAVGAVVSGTPDAGVVPLMAATAFAVAAANVFNDRCDEIADAVNRPDRPLIAGPTTGSDADRFVLGGALAAVGVAAALGPGAAVAGGALLVTGLAYSLVLRRAMFVGQAAVAMLFAAPVVYGGWFAGGGATARTWIAAGLATGYVLVREILKGVPDRAGDLAAGYRTPATVLGEAGALRAFRVAAVGFCAALVAAFLATGDVPFLLASLVCGVGPTLRTVAMVRGRPSLETVNRAIAFSGLVFAFGVIPLLLLG